MRFSVFIVGNFARVCVPWRRGFTYSHKKDPRNFDHYRKACESGFTVNLSADSLKEADKLAESGLPVVVTVSADVKPHKTPAGRHVAICPAQLKDGMTCADCQLCAKPDRKAVIGFRAHGSGSKHVQIS